MTVVKIRCDGCQDELEPNNGDSVYTLSGGDVDLCEECYKSRFSDLVEEDSDDRSDS